MRQRRMLGAAVLGLVALAVVGCGAGQITQTDSQEAAVNGAVAETGDILVRDAELVYPEVAEREGPSVYPVGSDAEVKMALVNQSLTSDELVSARSDDAQRVAVKGETVIPGDTALTIAPTRPNLDRLLHAEMTVEGLTREVRPGQTIKVVLDFRRAGSVTVDLPIAAPAEPREEGPEPEPEH
ncbi:copper chaperone PCu(A)C [Qaidamihabitans albus]|uniref:copper chaperone PCu(A)C n=1 Tax=Qaidamihabitans albus TaxID=2795733 RepID=UPI0018F1408B|nr:copper chaperone PCu(A)C [Qaidamihabitans albus]